MLIKEALKFNVFGVIKEASKRNIDASFMPVNLFLYFMLIKEALMFPVFGVIKEASEKIEKKLIKL